MSYQSKSPAAKPTTFHSEKPAKYDWAVWLPKSIVCLREGYGRQFFISDLFAGITVGLIALPLALAFAIASHVPPAMGLYTAIVAGFLISALGGSRVQIGGPTGAFVVILAGIVDQFGLDGLMLASLMAGVILITMGLLRFGGLIKFIPYPVTTGFTAGIAVIIFSSQMKDFFGLHIPGNAPAGFVEQWIAYVHAMTGYGINWTATGIAAGGLGVIIILRRFAPRLPGAVIAVVLAAAGVWLFGLDQPGSHYFVETIGTRFGPDAIPRSLPMPRLPEISWETLGQIRQLIMPATTIAMLAAIESLLCAVVADGMIGGRHKSNVELLAQGTANIASTLFGGIPATGALARTAANVKNGGRTPLAGMIHAITLMAFLLLLAPYATRIPLAIFASVLVMVAWNMSEREHFLHLFRAPRSDIFVLLLTFGLTVFADLTIAVGVGMIMAAMLFMKRMSEVTNVDALRSELQDVSGDEFPEQRDPYAMIHRQVPDGVEVYEINGPFFFGVADRLQDILTVVERRPKIFILRMRNVSAVDATGLHALQNFWMRCRRQHIRLLLSGVHAQPIFAMQKYGLIDKISEENLFSNIDDALNEARRHLGLQQVATPTVEPDAQA